MGSVRQDKVQVILEVQGSAAKTELDNLERKSRVLSDELKGLKKGTQEYIDKNKELGQVTAQMGKLQSELGITSLSLKQLAAMSRGLNREINDLVPGTQEFIDKSAKLIEVDNRLGQVREAAKGVNQALGTGGSGIMDFVKKGAALGGVALGAEAVINGIIGQGQAIFDTTAKFEKYFAILENNLGDKNLAAESMQMIAELAASTPFSVDQLTGSFVKFVNRGIIPTKAELTTLGDLAASQGKDFDQLTEAILDATSGGGFERLKEFGIQASKSGDEVSLSFKGIQKTVANTPAAINEAITAFGQMKGVAGSMGAIAATLEGQVSNLGDTADQVRVTLGQELRPVFVALIGAMLTFLNVLKATPAFLRENKDLFVTLGAAVLAFNARQIALTTSTIALNAVERAKAIALTASATAQRLLNAAMTANPIGLVVTAVTLLIGAFVMLYNRSAAVREALAGLGEVCSYVFDTIKKVALDNLKGVALLLEGIFTGNLGKIRQGGQLLIDSAKEVGAGVAAAYAKGSAEQEAREEAASKERAAKTAERKKEQAKANAEQLAEQERKAALESAKNEEAALKVKLARQVEGSAAELAVKKRLVDVAADIDVLGEKKTKDEIARIRQEALAERIKLDADYRKKKGEEAAKLLKQQQKDAADSAAVDEHIAELRVAGIADETERKLAQLKVAAAKEIAQLKGNAEQVATQKQLIEERLSVQLAEVQDAADKKKLDAAKKTAEAELELEQRTALAKAKLRVTVAEKGQSPEELLAARLNLARVQLDQELSNEKLTAEERLSIYEDFLTKKDLLNADYLEKQKQKTRDEASFALETASQAVGLLADFQKLDADRQLNREEKDKARRLKSLEAEYKAGKISKEQFEKQKTNIEEMSDLRSRQIKKKAAQDEKATNIAQAVIAGVLAVLKAAPNIPLQVVTGILAAASVAKIIATPIPEFAQGGIVGAGRAVARSFGQAYRSMRKYAHGGRINPTAGVADVGQLHGRGGIRMVDGLTGEHLGEWERGEPYMILSRATYANNRQVVDELLDTSMNRGGAPIRRRGGLYAADGALTGPAPAAGAGGGGNDLGLAMLAAQQETTRAVRELPSRLQAVVDADTVSAIGEVLAEQEQVRQENRT